MKLIESFVKTNPCYTRGKKNDRKRTDAAQRRMQSAVGP